MEEKNNIYNLFNPDLLKRLSDNDRNFCQNLQKQAVNKEVIDVRRLVKIMKKLSHSHSQFAELMLATFGEIKSKMSDKLIFGRRDFSIGDHDSVELFNYNVENRNMVVANMSDFVSKFLKNHRRGLSEELVSRLANFQYGDTVAYKTYGRTDVYAREYEEKSREYHNLSKFGKFLAQFTGKKKKLDESYYDSRWEWSENFLSADDSGFKEDEGRFR